MLDTVMSMDQGVNRMSVVSVGAVPNPSLWNQDCHQPEWQRGQGCPHSSPAPRYLHGQVNTCFLNIWYLDTATTYR